MRIDSHIHLYDPDMGDYSWPKPGSKYHRLFSTDAYGEELGERDCHAVLIGCSSEYELNQKLCALAHADNRIVAYIAQFDPSDPQMPSYARSLARYSTVYRGFRCDMDQILQYPERVLEAWMPGTVIELLGYCREILHFYDWMKEHREITFVIEHFGAYLFEGQPVPQSYIEECSKLASLPNVAIKLSGMFTLCQIPGKPQDLDIYYEACKVVLDTFGYERCMYGSDWPVLGVPLEACERVNKEIFRKACGENAARQVMGGNAERIYNLDGSKQEVIDKTLFLE